MMNSFLNLGGGPRRPVSMVSDNIEQPDLGQPDYGETPSFLNVGQQPARPTYGQAFGAGFNQTQGGLGKKLLGGLSGYSGGGGFAGGIGNIAKFFI